MKRIVETQRLVLEPLCMKHFDTYYKYATDADTTKYMVYLPMSSREDTVQFLTEAEAEWDREKPRAYEFAIMYRDVNVGEISVYDVDGLVELGWILDREYQGLGIAGEAARAIIDFTVNELGMRHFIAHCDTENKPSYSLMEKIGMTRVSECGGRKNKSSDEERREYTYELIVQ